MSRLEKIKKVKTFSEFDEKSLIHFINLFYGDDVHLNKEDFKELKAIIKADSKRKNEPIYYNSDFGFINRTIKTIKKLISLEQPIKKKLIILGSYISSINEKKIKKVIIDHLSGKKNKQVLKILEEDNDRS